MCSSLGVSGTVNNFFELNKTENSRFCVIIGEAHVNVGAQFSRLSMC